MRAIRSFCGQLQVCWLLAAVLAVLVLPAAIGVESALAKGGFERVFLRSLAERGLSEDAKLPESYQTYREIYHTVKVFWVVELLRDGVPQPRETEALVASVGQGHMLKDVVAGDDEDAFRVTLIKQTFAELIEKEQRLRATQYVPKAALAGGPVRLVDYVAGKVDSYRARAKVHYQWLPATLAGVAVVGAGYAACHLAVGDCLK